MRDLAIPVGFRLASEATGGRTTVVLASSVAVVLRTHLDALATDLTSTYARTSRATSKSIHLLHVRPMRTRLSVDTHEPDGVTEWELARHCLLDHLTRLQASAHHLGHPLAVDVGDEAWGLIDLPVLQQHG